VMVFGRNSANPVLDSRFVDLDLAIPEEAVTSFTPPAGARIRGEDNRGVLRVAADQLPPVALPETLAGLPRRTLEGSPPAIGLYGRGVTLLAVVPLPDGLARDLRRAGQQDPNAISDESGIRFAVGPLGILLGPPGSSTVLAGTVTEQALAQASTELAAIAGRP
jgi:hypothetical protein